VGLGKEEEPQRLPLGEDWRSWQRIRFWDANKFALRPKEEKAAGQLSQA
jgi:hypothetical protein